MTQTMASSNQPHKPTPLDGFADRFDARDVSLRVLFALGARSAAITPPQVFVNVEGKRRVVEKAYARDAADRAADKRRQKKAEKTVADRRITCDNGKARLDRSGDHTRQVRQRNHICQKDNDEPTE